ncbi:MAG: PLP-dependent lyase/thiolase [Desulfobulbaceae bacterium]|nr:PLP-dependent lyase/thiolase [Desulfobulbaceae bacterium]
MYSGRKFDVDIDLGMEIFNTGLVRLNEISKRYNSNIYVKFEGYSLTGSHKDRESRYVTEDAKVRGYSKIGCASTGNLAISLSAYALKRNLECHVWVSENISGERLRLIKMFSPVIHRVGGDYLEAVLLSNSEMGKYEIYNANPGECQGKIEGNSVIGYEISKSLRPDVIICPTNNGSLLRGVWLGLNKMDIYPKMVAVIAMQTNLADSIYGFHGLDNPNEIIQESDGEIVDVSDSQIKKACKDLFFEGIVSEPASASAVAALGSLRDIRNKNICCIITGSGMKYTGGELYCDDEDSDTCKSYDLVLQR